METGLRVQLRGGFQLSVQTDPLVANDAFAETALLKDNHYTENEKLGYDDVKRFVTPDSLFAHIADLYNTIEEKAGKSIPEADK